MKPIRHPSLERESIRPVTWGLLVAVLILAMGEVLGGLYLIHRAELQRQGACAILDRFPLGNVALDTARTDYRCGAPHPPKVPLGPTPVATVTAEPRPRVTVTSPPRIVLTPGPARLIVTPGPTVTVTRHPKGKQRPTHSPTPKPSPSRSCLLTMPSICLPAAPL